jgi:hypothetical protein
MMEMLTVSTINFQKNPSSTLHERINIPFNTKEGTQLGQKELIIISGMSQPRSSQVHKLTRQ